MQLASRLVRRSVWLAVALSFAACKGTDSSSEKEYRSDSGPAIVKGDKTAAPPSVRPSPAGGTVSGAGARGLGAGKTPAAPVPAPAAPVAETVPPAVPAPAPAAPAAAGRIDLVDAGVKGDPMGVTIHRLRNGITVMLSENHDQPRVAAWVTVRAGSSNDPPDATGMAHYLEHMQFKGTPRIGTLDWEKEKPHLDRITQLYDELFVTTDTEKRAQLYAQIDAENQEAVKYVVPSEIDHLYNALGGQGINANTSFDQINYVVDLPANRLEQWALVETERLREPVYRLFQQEIESVYEEKNQALDNPQRKSFEVLMAAAFPNHPYGTQTTLGSIEHLKNPSVTKMYEFFRTWYAPGNLCIEIAGDFESAAVLELLDRTFGTLEARPFPENPKRPVAPLSGVTRVEFRHKGDQEIGILYLLPDDSHPDHDALVLADMVLANGQTGLIDVNLEQAQVVRSAGSQQFYLRDAGLEILTASPKPGQTLDDLEDLLLEQVEMVKSGAFSDEDLAAAITEFEIREKRGLESNSTRVGLMARAFVDGTPWERRVRSIERLKKVTKAEVVAAAAKYLKGDYVVIRRLDEPHETSKMAKPGFTKVTIDPSTRTTWFREMVGMKVSPIEPRFVVKGVDVEEVALKSGTLVYTHNPINDIFDLSFTIPVGTDANPKLSLALGLVDLGGAGDLDRIALKRKLYALGSTITAGANREECVISVSGLEANLKATIDLLRTHFEAPTGVGQAELDAMIPRVTSSRNPLKKTGPAVAGALAEFARRGPDSAFLKQPTDEELASWKAEDLLAAAKDVWRYRRTVQYVGQLPVADVAALVDVPPLGGTHDDLVDAPPRKPVAYVKPEKDRVLFTDQQLTQTHLQIAAADGGFDPANVPFTRVYNEYMSGSMSAVVFQEIREARSLSYDPSTGYIVPAWREDENAMTGGMRTQADKTVDAVGALMEIVRRMPASGTRFEAAIDSVNQTYQVTRTPFRRIPQFWTTWRRQGYDGDPRPWNWARVREMKMEDLVAWAKRFEAKPFTVAVTGPRDRVDLEKLKQFGEVTEMKVEDLFSW